MESRGRGSWSPLEPATAGFALVLAGLLALSAGGCSSGSGAAHAHAALTLTALKPIQGAAVDVEADPPVPAPSAKQGKLQVELLGRFAHTERFATSAAEIPAYDPASRRLFVVNAEQRRIDVLDVSSPETPQLVTSIDVSQSGRPTSVSCKHGMIAASVAASDKTQRGHVLLLSPDGNVLSTVEVGFEPDMLTFSPDCHWLLTANEGEPTPDYKFDPAGTISRIDVSAGAAGVTQQQVTEIGFERFDDHQEAFPADIRICGPGATISQDLEPEYIAVSPDSATAWVSLQENNAVGVIDVAAGQVTKVVSLGSKDLSLDGNWIDASDEDEAIRLRPWPVKALYQPDGMCARQIGGQVYLFSANEGDSREYPGFNEECRVADLQLNPAFFANAADLQKKKHLGRLRTTSATGDYDRDGLFDELFCCGARSFSIWTADVEQVFDSGDQFERVLAAESPEHFNADNESHRFDDRSDNKGPEPEAVTVAEVNGGWFAVVGLERAGGLMIYDVTDPRSPKFDGYVNTRDFSVEAGPGSGGDLGPEGLLFVPAGESPNREPLLIVANEISGTTCLYRLSTAAAVKSH